MGPEVARGRTLLKRAKMFIFCHRRGIEILSSVFIHERPKVFFFGRLPGACHISPAVV